MPLRLRFAVLGAFVALALLPLPILADSGSPPSVPGEWIVGFRDEAALRSPSRAGSGSARIVRRTALLPAALVRVAADEDPGETREALLARPDVAWAHPNYIGRGGFIPSDTHVMAQWHLNNGGQSGGTAGADIGARLAWDIARGSASVTVAILDSGIDTDHPEFAGRLLPGYDFVNGDADPEDDWGHGTQVAGLLAANADDSFGTAGVDHFCRILPVKVLDSAGLGTTFDLIAGLDWARQNGADVINLSLIDYPLSAGLDAALAAAEAAGIPVVASSGNGGAGDADVSAPGASVHTISVGATTHSDALASFSGTGQSVDFVAPGAFVQGVVFDSGADATAPFTGTSASAPIAAGIVCVLKGVAPGLSPADIRQLLQAGAADQVGIPAEDTPGWDPNHGWGRLNLLGSLQALAGSVTAPLAGQAGRAVLHLSPNPSRGDTSVRFGLPAPARVRAAVFDVSGRRIRRILDAPRPAGPQFLLWNGRGDDGRPAPAGVYLIRVEAGSAVHSGKVTLRP